MHADVWHPPVILLQGVWVQSTHEKESQLMARENRWSNKLRGWPTLLSFWLVAARTLHLNRRARDSFLSALVLLKSVCFHKCFPSLHEKEDWNIWNWAIACSLALVSLLSHNLLCLQCRCSLRCWNACCAVWTCLRVTASSRFLCHQTRRQWSWMLNGCKIDVSQIVPLFPVSLSLCRHGVEVEH